MKHMPIDIDSLYKISSGGKTFIFLDSARFSKENNRFSYLFYNPVETISAFTYDEVEKLLKNADNYMKNNWLCGYLSYETSYALEKRFFRFQKTRSGSLPLGWFGIFNEPWIFNHSSGTWNKPLPKVSNNVFINEKMKKKLYIAHFLKKSEFYKNIDCIKKAIERGDTYQVNYTYDVMVKSELPPFLLYKHLRENQKTPYCSFLQNEHGYVASFSPELFFRKNGQKISTKPMKGTASRGHSVEDDQKQIRFLRNDVKNCAENLMIVDLLRNDLGRICEAGSVITEKLFDVETHPTIHQMTSEITGLLKKDNTFSDIIKNLFPCGSVTGAPKIRTMEIIHDIEKGERGVYCGALGYLSPDGNGVFNIPIRTLQKSSQEKDWRYRVGSGIIWDSTAEGEWKECAQKTSFLEYEMPGFEIIETLLFDKKFVFLEEHKKRMMASAHYFQYPCSEEILEAALKNIQEELDLSLRYKIRMLLSREGKISWEKSIISDTSASTNKLKFSTVPVNEKNTYLFHKTTYRPWYKQAMEDIKGGLYYDMVFFNKEKEITEGAISNIFVRKNGTLYTPPVSCGLLPGTLRMNLIRSGKCKEKVLFKKDLFDSDKVYCGNSVRGLVEVNLEE
jgi:para-aminobenzoate synthetase/4-amino-4-deoxychorismate lyase